MIIRQATVDDCLSIAKVLTVCWKVTYKGLVSQRFLNKMTEKSWLERLRKLIEGNTTTLLVAEEEDVVVGVIGYGKSRWHDNEAWGEVYSLYVLPHYQKRAIGTTLIKTAQQKLSQRFSKLTVLAMKGNEPAIRFYESIGFCRKTDTIQSELDGKTYYNIVFEKVINKNA